VRIFILFKVSNGRDLVLRSKGPTREAWQNNAHAFLASSL